LVGAVDLHTGFEGCVINPAAFSLSKNSLFMLPCFLADVRS
jgi:hypothetical protein